MGDISSFRSFAKRLKKDLLKIRERKQSKVQVSDKNGLVGGFGESNNTNKLTEDSEEGASDTASSANESDDSSYDFKRRRNKKRAGLQANHSKRRRKLSPVYIRPNHTSTDARFLLKNSATRISSTGFENEENKQTSNIQTTSPNPRVTTALPNETRVPKVNPNKTSTTMESKASSTCSYADNLLYDKPPSSSLNKNIKTGVFYALQKNESAQKVNQQPIQLSDCTLSPMSVSTTNVPQTKLIKLLKTNIPPASTSRPSSGLPSHDKDLAKTTKSGKAAETPETINVVTNKDMADCDNSNESDDEIDIDSDLEGENGDQDEKLVVVKGFSDSPIKLTIKSNIAKNCPVVGCEEIYTAQFDLQKHVMDVHKLRLRSCEDCEGKLFVDYDSHRREFHDFVKTCPFCPKEFKTKTQTRAHVSKFHPEIIGLHQALPQTESSSNKNISLQQKLDLFVSSKSLKTPIVTPSFIVNYDHDKNRPIFAFEYLKIGTKFKKFKEQPLFENDLEHTFDPETIRALNLECGHLAPRANSTNLNEYKETFRMTNVVPQPKTVNSGPMNSIELHCRKLSRSWNVGILTVPVYQSDATCWRGKSVHVPSYLFKLVTLERGCEKQYIVFQVKNTRSNLMKVFYNCISTLQELKSLSGLELLLDTTQWKSTAEVAEQKTTFICNKYRCWKAFLSESQYEEHMIEHEQKICCWVCHKYIDNDDFKTHFKSHPSFNCVFEKCSQVFYTARDKKRHEETVHCFTSIKCVFCKADFENINEYNKHRVTHGNKIGLSDVSDLDDRVCTVCFEAFFDSKKRVFHENESHNKAIKCSLCSAVLENVKDYNKHVSDYHNKSEQEKLPTMFDHVCSICKKSCKTKDSLKRHQVFVHQWVTSCPFCNEVFTNAQEYNRHLKSHEKDMDGVNPNSMNLDAKICRTCFQSFCEKSARERHEKTAHKINLRCHFCQKDFNLLAVYNTHLNNHQQEIETANLNGSSFKLDNNICPKCFMAFTSSSSRIHHEILHKQEKWQCKICRIQFDTKHAYKTHTITHQKPRQFICHICSKEFIQKHQLDEHMLVHSNKRPYVCLYAGCKKAYKRKSDMLRHVAKIHTKKKQI